MVHAIVFRPQSRQVGEDSNANSQSPHEIADRLGCCAVGSESSPKDAVISDALNHASIIDGIRLCKAQRYRYGHMDMAHLEDILKECAGKGTRHRMIVTDGVFSMDGDIAPLKEICDLAERYDAQVFVDECHATGFLGKTGRGTPQLCGVEGRVDVINSTLGKALGGATGGYTTGPRVLIDLLRNKARPYLFSNTLAPSVAGASIEVGSVLGGQPLRSFAHSGMPRCVRRLDQEARTGRAPSYLAIAIRAREPPLRPALLHARLRPLEQISHGTLSDAALNFEVGASQRFGRRHCRTCSA